MSTHPREHFLSWLRDAYAMEKQAQEMCERQAERIDTYPELKTRIAKHVEETKGQITRLERCFSILDEDPSTVKNALGWMTGNLQALGGMMASDEVIKGSLASYTFENMEIASYTILLAAADHINEPEIMRLCRDNLHEEEAMAQWLREHIPGTVDRFLMLDSVDQRARA